MPVAWPYCRNSARLWPVPHPQSRIAAPGTIAHRLGQKECHEAPEPSEPEMIPFGPGGGLKKSIHYADTAIDSMRSGR